MAKLWSIPAVFVCENNQYGMGTSTARSSMNPNYYTQVGGPMRLGGSGRGAAWGRLKLALPHA
jgi:hypothetical protein